MKIFLLLFFISIPAPVFADSPSEKQYDNDAERLDKRVSRLERKTHKMQRQINQLTLHTSYQCKGSDAITKKSVNTDEHTPQFSCFLQTAFKTYTATENTKVDARDKVVKLCQVDKALGCNLNEVECD